MLPAAGLGAAPGAAGARRKKVYPALLIPAADWLRASETLAESAGVVLPHQAGELDVAERLGHAELIAGATTAAALIQFFTDIGLQAPRTTKPSMVLSLIEAICKQLTGL